MSDRKVVMDIINIIREEIEFDRTTYCSFPKVKILRMEKIWSLEPEVRRCFLYLGMENGETTLDAFVWDQYLPNNYYRFHISRKSDLSTYEKGLLESYCMLDGIKVKKSEMRDVLWGYQNDFPDILNWERNNPLWVVHRIYFMQRTGLRRTLYDEGLHWFAMEMESFTDYNLIGTTLTEIMDGIPVSLFGKMNTRHGVAMLRDYDRRLFFQKAYLWYPNIFQNVWNQYQCHYFENYIWPKGTYAHEDFDKILNKDNRRILLGLASVRSNYAYGKYLCYKEIRDAVEDIVWLPPFPRGKRYWLYRLSEEIYRYYLGEDAKQIRSSLEKKLCYCPEYETKNEKYIVRCPRDLAELFREIEISQTMLWAEFNHVAEGSIKLLFFGEANYQEDTFLILRISGGRLDVLPTDWRSEREKEIKEWLQEYAVSKNLSWKEI